MHFSLGFIGGKHRFPLVSLLYSYHVVPPLDVKFGELCTVAESINELWYEGERVVVSDSPLVYGAIVLHRSELSVLFLDTEESCSIWTFQRAYSPSFLVFFEKFLEFLLFGLG
jgi:hypothetical protein